VADYFTLLSRAVASLPHNTRDAREALYNRARSVLVEQLRASEPPLSDAQIEAEAASLESSIRQIEFEVRRSTGRRAREPQNEPRPPRRQIDAAEDAVADTDWEQAPQTTRRSLSPAVIGVVGAIALAIAAAGSYAYLSRPGAKPSATAVRTGGSTPSQPTKPGAPQQETNKKTVSAQNGKTADTDASALPYVLRRQLVFYRSTYPPGTIVIAKSQHMLYQIRAETVALRYSIAVGSKCLDTAGLHRVSGKETSPVWPPAPSGSEHRPDGRFGARILYLSDIDYGIHGTDKPNAIGRNSAFGCFLLEDDDISDLYNRTPVDTRVVIMN
jgi:lipoprotein-anchoring transpeptidase ErfK/SrfK